MLSVNRDPTLVEAIRVDDHVLGSAEAPIEMIEYGDFECPYSRRAYAAARSLRERLGDRFRFAYRHFPQRDIHADAQELAEAAEAAAAQGKFWEMHDVLWAEFGAFTRDELMGHAGHIGMDVERFADDLAHHRFADRVERDVQTGLASGVSVTPSFYIGGVRYDRGRALDAGFLQRRIEQAAARETGERWPPRERVEHG